MEAYDDIAQLYNMAVENNVGDSNFCGLVAPKIYAHFKASAVARQQRQALDLGCGTGQQSIYLAQQGMQVSGLDISKGMLNVAQANAVAAGCQQDVSFNQQDILGEQPFDAAALIVATFNIINHLPDEAAVLRLFEKTFDALIVGGLFAFDMSTATNMRSWDSFGMNEIPCDFDDVEQATVISSKSHCAETQRNLTEVTCFFKVKEDELYRRSNSRIYSYIYSLERLQTLLFKVGFTEVNLVDVNLNPIEQPEAQDIVLFLVGKSESAKKDH